MNYAQRNLNPAWIPVLLMLMLMGCVPEPVAPTGSQTCTHSSLGGLVCISTTAAPTGTTGPTGAGSGGNGGSGSGPSFNGQFQLVAGSTSTIPCYKETGAIQLVAPSASYTGTITFSAETHGSVSGIQPDYEAEVDVGYTQNVNDIVPIYDGGGPGPTHTYQFTSADHGVIQLGFQSWAEDVANETITDTFTVTDTSDSGLTASITLTGTAGPPVTTFLDSTEGDNSGGPITLGQCTLFTAKLLDACFNPVTEPSAFSLVLSTTSYDSGFNPSVPSVSYSMSQSDCQGGSDSISALTFPANTNTVDYWVKLPTAISGCAYLEFDVDGSGNPDPWLAEITSMDGSFYSCGN
jgi:hypothetical protein